MGRKESRIVAYLEHSPIRVGDKIVLETNGKRPPRMTIEELAEIVRTGFAKQEEFNNYVLHVFKINKLILPD